MYGIKRLVRSDALSSESPVDKVTFSSILLDLYCTSWMADVSVSFSLVLFASTVMHLTPRNKAEMKLKYPNSLISYICMHGILYHVCMYL